MLIQDPNYYLKHYGTKRHSGRYAWGSGGENESEGGDSSAYSWLLEQIDKFKKQGMTETEIAAGLGMSTTQLRAQKTIAKNEQKQATIAQAEKLRAKGYSASAIGRSMNLNESSVRSLLAPGQKDRLDILHTTANLIQEHVDKGKYVDVGFGVENMPQLGISDTKLKAAVSLLQDKGYQVHKVQIDQLGTAPGKKTIIKVVTPPGTTYKDVKTNMNKISQLNEYSDDGGRTYREHQPPLSIDSKRIAVKYAEDGGSDADGMIYVRPGVQDISLGKSRYAQVRVSVDDTHYLKGMALYKEDLPPGVDLEFHTNKSNTGNKKDVMKPVTGNPDDPFGALTKPPRTDPKTGKVVSAMNMVHEEGDWDTWSRKMSPQVLSKQSVSLAKSQLDMNYEKEKAEFDTINSLTNPAVRKLLLNKYAEKADAAAVHMKVAALPRSSYHAILPFNSMKETEIYAPNYNNGEKVALIRYPHGGTFEIPELTVNNKTPTVKSVIGNAPDAVGIHPNVAKRLSGADFDGDFVMVIPNNKGLIKSTPALTALKDFDPKSAYPKYEGMKVISPSEKQNQMGKITNLIADMTIKGAKPDELARAVKHSMVVIDSERHELNYKASAIDNGIAALKTRYQGGPNKGSATLITRAGSNVYTPQRKPRRMSEGGPVDPRTGELIYTPTGATRTDSKGRTTLIKEPVARLKLEKDARNLSSGTRMESTYADYSNKMKALSNQARKEAYSIKAPTRSASAAAVYKHEVASLNSKLTLANTNPPRERQAQLFANAAVAAKRAANPGMNSQTLKKIEGQELVRARRRTGASKTDIHITDREWDAIQSFAISDSRLKAILNNANLERVRDLATPKSDFKYKMTSAKINRARAMSAAGYTQAEIASALGVSLTTLKEGLKG
jgi:DNA-binding CsgD family transcriptional regulator